MDPVGSILSTNLAGVVTVITDPLVTDVNRMSIDLVNTDAVNSTQFSGACLFFLPLLPPRISVVNRRTSSENFAKALNSSI